MTPMLETPRLLLQPLSLEDAVQIQQVFPQWDIVRRLDVTVPWPYPDDGANWFLDHVVLPQQEAGTGWHWGIRRREEPDRLIGEITLQDVPDRHRGFWIVPDWQGRGYASEAAAAVTRFWFEDLDRPVLRVPKAADNQASRRISLSQGMRVIDSYIGHTVGGACPFELWELTREEWRARQ